MILFTFCLIPVIVAQLTTLSPNQNALLSQCNCIANPTGSGCLQYDSRLQAATIEEAMSSFPDLTLMTNADLGDKETIEAQSSCTTDDCIKCRDELKKKLQTIGLVSNTILDVITAQPNLTANCNKYSFTRSGTNEKKNNEKSDSSSEDDDDEDDKKKKNKKKEEVVSRIRRQATDPLASQNSSLIGQRFTISCSSKGIVTDATGMISLCSSCWVWRKLPDNYIPQFINELVCDTTDDACLSGYATCGVGHRTIEVLRDDNGVKKTVALTAGSYCECKIAAGSVLQSLVAGTGLNASLPVHTASGATSAGRKK